MSEAPIRILLIEDSIDDALLLKRALASARSRYNVCHVKRFHEAERELARECFDVVLTDLSLPDSDPNTIVARLCKSARGTPVVALTGMSSEIFALTLLDQGAQDYLLKDEITPEMLERSTQYAIGRNRSRREIERLLSEVQQSRQLLERKNRRLAKLYKTAQRFVNNVSHEFRTPLTVIREYTDLLREGVLGKVSNEQCRYLNIVVDRADDLNRMVDDMLDVSKLEAGLLGAWRKKCYLPDIVDYHCPALARKAELKNIHLKFDVPEDLPAVYCDAEKVGRVIVNLAVNAIKYCNENDVVKVWARAEDDETGVLVGVTDGGPGIDLECQQAIFQRFKQLGTDCRSSTKGVGLGLNIAQELVELNFGEMRLESRMGEGSTFSFTLPPDEPEEVVRRYLRRMRAATANGHGDAYVSFVRASVDESCHETLVEEVDSFFNYQLRRHDLLFRTSVREWLLIVPEPESQVALLFDRVREQRNQANRNRPGESLPEIALHRHDTWPVQTETPVILESLRRLLDKPEFAHA